MKTDLLGSYFPFIIVMLEVRGIFISPSPSSSLPYTLSHLTSYFLTSSLELLAMIVQNLKFEEMKKTFTVVMVIRLLFEGRR